MSAVYPLFLISHLSHLPPTYVQAGISGKCSAFDSSCLTNIGQHYTPLLFAGKLDLGLSPLDPMFLTSVGVKESGLFLHWTEIRVQGLQNVIMDVVENNKQERRLRMKMRFPILSMVGNYTGRGFIHNLPFNGQGQNVFNLFDVEDDMVMNYKIVKGQDGKDHIELIDYFYWFNMRFSEPFFENLNTDSPLRLQADEYQRKNWKILWQQLGRVIWDRIDDRIFEALKSFFRSYAVEDIAYDY